MHIDSVYSAKEGHMGAEEKIKNLPCWSGDMSINELDGGLTNYNYVVQDQEKKAVVRIGEDIPNHGVMRFHELEASIAAAKIGLSPAVLYHEKGVLVLEFIEGKTLESKDFQNQKLLEKALNVVKVCHHKVSSCIKGPNLMFWTFQVNRNYMQFLNESRQCRLQGHLDQFNQVNSALEKIVQPIDLVFSHNDLLAANFIDDGKKLWLIDWDYAGFNSPLFDLSGLSSNNDFTADQERFMLEYYFDEVPTDLRWTQYKAMKCATALRETLWSLVSEQESNINFDFIPYTDENMDRFQKFYKDYEYGEAA